MSYNNLERLANPNLLDIVFPVFAFIIVIIIPSIFALWVIFKIITGRFFNSEN